MAIKAIINNTEKEIEQIKNNNEQDIDYVYSRIGDTEVEGEPPISIKSIGGTLADYRIYGQTVDGESVGDRTGNLFDSNINVISGYLSDEGILKPAAESRQITFDYIPIISGTYTFTYTVPSAYDLWFGVCTYDESRTFQSRLVSNYSGTATFTISDTTKYIRISLRGYNKTPIIMLNEGSTALPYEPYGYKVPVTAEGKNLLPNTATSQTVNGVTFTVNSDGSVTCNGTANVSEPSVIYIPFTLPIKLYELSGCPDSGSTSTYRMDIRNYDHSVYKYNGKNVVDDGTGCLFDGGNNRCCIRIAPGYTCNNLTFYPMIRLATIGDDIYEPYQPPATTNLYLPEQIKMVGDEAEYISYAEQKMHRIGADDIDVTLPALSTIKGTNILSVGTSIQPSNMYIKDNFDYKKVFIATRTIEGELPLNYRSIEDSDSTLSNYRIYGNTVNGESVGDRTGNLFDMSTIVEGKYISSSGIETSSTAQYQENMLNHTDFVNISNDTVYSLTCTMPYVIALDNTIAFCWFDDNKSLISRSTNKIGGKIGGINVDGYSFSATSPSNAVYLIVNFIGYVDETTYMLNEGSTPLPYEPYGYKVPVTVSNGTDTETTNLYLPEQIKMVGDEAEYIDYGEQKQHRVRGNYLQTSDFERGAIFTGKTYKNRSYQNSKTQPGQLNYDSTRKRSTNLITIIGTYTISITDGWEFGIVMFPNDSNTGEQFIYNTKPVTISNCTFAIQIKKSDLSDISSADISDYKIVLNKGSTALPYEPYIEDTELDVTLPALPTLPGTNVLSVGTEAQPSDIYLKGKIKKKPKIYYKIYYYSQDGQTALSTETVEEGHDCTYSTVPTKESDTDFDYTFTGWSTSTNSTTATAGATENIQQNTNLYAAFSKSFKTDTISDSWEEIIANCDNGTYASKYQIGDLKTIDVGTEGPVQMQIVAIDTDLLASDNTKKAPITWISKQLLNTDKVMNDTSTNYLSDWTNCDMRTYLKNTVLPMLPSVVQNNIKEVTKYTNQRTGSTTFTTISSTEDIWLPSYREISNNTSNCETSGVQYNSIFTDDASRVKSKVGNRANIWWTRSASGYSSSACSYCFVIVYSDGTANRAGSYCIGFCGVAIGFCT